VILEELIGAVNFVSEEVSKIGFHKFDEVVFALVELVFFLLVQKD
jgi:hypothetical protein